MILNDSSVSTAVITNSSPEAFPKIVVDGLEVIQIGKKQRDVLDFAFAIRVAPSVRLRFSIRTQVTRHSFQTGSTPK
jgi:hypothetical protein